MEKENINTPEKQYRTRHPGQGNLFHKSINLYSPKPGQSKSTTSINGGAQLNTEPTNIDTNLRASGPYPTQDVVKNNNKLRTNIQNVLNENNNLYHSPKSASNKIKSTISGAKDGSPFINEQNQAPGPTQVYYNRSALQINNSHGNSSQSPLQVHPSSAAPANAPATAGVAPPVNGFNANNTMNNTAVYNDGNSRRFSIFSKTSMATSSSFMFGTRYFGNQSQMSQQQQSCPQVNIGNIIKQKAVLYLDQALANTFDDLLEKGYTIVATKKEERDMFKTQESGMKQEIYNLEQQIMPLINQMHLLQQNVEQQRKLEIKYTDEIGGLEGEIEDLAERSKYRVVEITENNNRLNEEIKKLEIENNDIRSQINISQTNHQMEKEDMSQLKKGKDVELEKLVRHLNELKQVFDEQQLSQAEQLRQMGNKSQMFIGILQH